MFKLVAIGGQIRGTEIELTEGPNTVGRSPEVDHQLDIDGVSKKHLRITVNKESAFIEDMGSSNGTFVNGEMIKKKGIENGDRIALPNVIFQVVYVKEKIITITKKVARGKDDEEGASPFDQTPPAPKSLVPKLKWAFRYKVMPIIYGFNEQYEWRVLLGILIAGYTFISIAVSIMPVLNDSRTLLMNEIARRGGQYASEVARLNQTALGRKDIDRIDTSFLDTEEGINSYELFTFQGRIVRPVSKLNAIVNDPFSVRAWEFFKKSSANIYRPLYLNLGKEIGVARAVTHQNFKSGRSEPVGIIVIKFAPPSLAQEASNNSRAYLEALALSGVIGIILFGFIFYMTTRPIEELKFQVENVLRGRQKELESKGLMSEIAPLRNSLNSVLQRIRELQGQETDDFNEMEDDSAYVRSLYEFLQGAQGPVLTLNSEKNIQNINAEAEDLVGMRESSASGTSLLDSMKDQGLAATLIDLCDQSANNDGCNQSDLYEIGGRDYNVHVSSLIGKDGFAKAFYVTFVLDE